MTPADQQARERALDPTRSFLVQAPAGSGKTELLIQRYLRLLTTVSRPESVVAITFTKKAASEMRRRVLEALEDADGPSPEEEHKENAWRLARAVREHDRKLGWDLAQNPLRLEIRTIDSLCVALVRRMPWLSRMGPQPELVEDASELHFEAAQRTVDLLEQDRYGDAIEPLLKHVDNKQDRLVKLLAAMLARRDQWLRHVYADRATLRENIENLLRRDIEERLQQLEAELPEMVASHAVELMRHAAANLQGKGKHAEIQRCAGVTRLPAPDASDLEYWRALASLLLTTQGQPRAGGGVNVQIGFPTTAPQIKRTMCEVVADLALHLAFCELLAEVPKLPEPRFDQAQWNVLEALLETLPVAAAQLRLVFDERGQTDFVAVAQAALQAMGDDQAPTDLALALDGRIEHLLVDEFQDTSHSQMRLLEKLTLGWTPGDGRTLFLVGDPMQSIYRFREAEVGLFLGAARHGLPNVPLEPLQLSVNFRSRRNIVDWVNQVFPKVFSQQEDIAVGAVRFAASSCASQQEPGPAVEIHPFWEESKGDQQAAEAAAVRDIALPSRQAGKSVAILARSRSHLPAILEQLRQAGIRYSAVEIDPLDASPAVLDLLSLTTALLHPGDRVSWLAVLRAPWCGLSLHDLHALAGDEPKSAIPELLANADRLARLSEQGRERVGRLLRGMTATRPRTLRAWVEGVWLRLGGPASVAAESGLDDAGAFFELLEETDRGCDADLDLLRGRVAKLFAAPDPAAGQEVQVMTIHKAKGLEFDVVIVPGLGRKAKSDDDQLMIWFELPDDDGAFGGDLLLAPLKSAAVASDSIYRYIQRMERQKERHELARLLYVAATRAKSELHLLGAVRLQDGEAKPPAKDTLLSLLWPAVEPMFDSPPPSERSAPEGDAPVRRARRLTAGWPGALSAPARPDQQQPRRYRAAVHRRRAIGTAVHDMLQEIGREGAKAWSLERIRAARPRLDAALRAAGLEPDEIRAASDQAELALTQTLDDERGRWILDASHQDAQSEAALTGVVDGRVVDRRIDRTFVDAEGVRWIVDFKVTPRKKGDIETVVDKQMERYRAQMQDYRTLYRRIEDRSVRIGLYFPLLGVWREYEEVERASV